MTEDDLERLWTVGHNKPVVQADQFGDRTLLYGYDCDRKTWHFFQRGDKLIQHIYTMGRTVSYVEAGFWQAEGIVPNKRLYPEACDYEFCKKLKEMGVALPFTTFNLERAKEQFYGETAEFHEWG